jgi:cytochrome c
MFRVRSFVAFWLVVGGFALAQQMRYNVRQSCNPGRGSRTRYFCYAGWHGITSGHGTAAQGRVVFEAKCASCHGKRGEGTADFPPLAGGLGTLASHEPNPTIGSYWPYAITVWDYVHRAMPYQRPGSLSENQVYSVTAYILFVNGIIGKRDQLDRETLPKVRMPNRNGFVPDPRPDVK